MQSESTNKSQKNNKQKILIVCFVAFFLLGIYFLIGKPMIAFVGDADGFQEYVKSRGIFGLLVFGFFVFLQTLSNCIPGLPFYLAAGAAFGGIKGAIICDIFATMANTTAFLLGKNTIAKRYLCMAWLLFKRKCDPMDPDHFCCKVSAYLYLYIRS